MGGLFFPASNGALILCVRLPSTPRFHTVREQAVRLPGSSSFLNFISDAAVSRRSLLRDCGFVPAQTFCGRVSPAGRPGNVLKTVLLPTPIPGASPPQKKFTRACSSSVSGILENHNSHLAPDFTPNGPVPAPANVVVLQDPLGPLPLGIPPRRGTASHVARGPRSLLLGIRPSHQSSTRYAAAELWTLRSPCLQSLMEFKPSPSPFSLFCSVPCVHFLFSPAAFGRWGWGDASCTLPRLRPLSASTNSSLPSVTFSPSSALHAAAYLLNSVVQAVQIVVLILRSVF